jgi:CheY-like chemotaxis protein
MKKIIMLVDDDKDDRFFFGMALKKSGEYEYRQAESGIAALEQLKAERVLPDYIFLDINMSNMNGKECLAELKKNERLKGIPVIIYTTSTSQEDQDSTRRLGAAYYLTKPMDTSMIAAEIAAALEFCERLLEI